MSSGTAEKFLVAGGQTALGSWVVRLLLDEGASFVLHGPRPRNASLAQVLEPEEIAGLTRIFSKVSGGGLALARALERHEITRVIHLPGGETTPAVPATAAAAPDPAAQGLFEAVRAARAVTMTAYAAQAGSPFAAAARRAHEEHGVRSAGLTPGLLYGAGLEEAEGGLTRAITAAVLARGFTVPFSGTVSITYAGDAARSLIAAARSEVRGAVTAAMPSLTLPLEEFIDELARAVPECRGRIRCEGEARSVAFELEDDAAASREESLAVPPTPLAEGLRRTVARLRRLAEDGRLRHREG